MLRYGFLFFFLSFLSVKHKLSGEFKISFSKEFECLEDFFSSKANEKYNDKRIYRLLVKALSLY